MSDKKVELEVERESWITNQHPEGYRGITSLVIAGKITGVKGDIEDKEMLNGFEVEIKTFEEPKIKYKGTAIMWNSRDKNLYVVTKYLGMIDEDKADKLANNTVDEWPKGDYAISEDKFPGITVNFTEDLDEVFPSMLPLIAPKGKHFLGVIFETPEMQMMYEDFLSDHFMYARVRKLCIDNGLEVTKKMTKMSDLPVHVRDTNTGEILISDKMVKLFSQFQFCRNFLVQGVGTAEHDLGKIMMLDLIFCDYMMNRAELVSKGKEVSEENYTVQVTAAVKRLEADEVKMLSYENNLGYPLEELEEE
jgi:hypothetical protein